MKQRTPSSAAGRRAYQVLAGRIEAAASRMPYALSARWRICSILRGVYGCKVSDIDEAQAADAIEILDLVDQRVAWYLEQRRDVPEDQMRWIDARDVAVLLPTDAGRDYAQLAVMPALPPLRTPRQAARVIDLAMVVSARSRGAGAEEGEYVVKMRRGTPEQERFYHRAGRLLRFRDAVSRYCAEHSICGEPPCTCVECGRFELPDLDGTDEIRLIGRAQPVATIINLAERRRPHGRPSLTIVKGST